MKYLLMIYGSHAVWDAQTKESIDALMRVHQGLQEEVAARGELLDTNELSISEARVAWPSSGAPPITDGPYVETKEMIAGYYLLDCATMDRATEIARRLAEHESGPIEVRQIITR